MPKAQDKSANTLIHIFIWWRLSYDLAILNLEGGLGWSETCFAVSLYIADLYDNRLYCVPAFYYYLGPLGMTF